MPKLKIAATKMTDAKVSFISLVERGANRIPFKIVKQEKQDMAGQMKGLDLGSLFARKAEQPKPEVVGVVTLKGEGFDSIKGQIQEAGFAVGETLDMEDNSVVFKQVGTADGEGVVVRLSEHVALVTKGFRPYNMDIKAGDGSFAEVCVAQGFCPGVSTAVDVARMAILNAAETETDPAKAAQAVSKVCDELKAYVVSMVKALPSKAFKLESVFPEESDEGADSGLSAGGVEKAAKGKAKMTIDDIVEAMKAGASDEDMVAKGCSTEDIATARSKVKPKKDSEAEGEAKSKTKGTVKSDGQTAPEGGENSGDSKGDTLTEEKVSAIVAAKLEDAVGSFSQKMEEMLAAIQKGVTESLGGVTSQVEALAGRVEKAESEAEAATSALKGTLVGGSESGDHAPATKKSETSRGMGEIDTAYNSNVRKSARNR